MQQSPPFVWCPEKIVFIVDLSTEMNGLEYERHTEHAAPCTRLDVLKRALATFCRVKQALSSRHSFALWTFVGTTTKVVADFTSDMDSFLTTIDSLEPTNHYSTFDMASVFECINREFADLPSLNEASITPPYIYRVIMVFGRSLELPFFSERSLAVKLLRHPYLYLDGVYMHGKASEHTRPQAIYDFLNDVVQQTSRNKSAYCLENTAKISRVHTNFGKLLAHPLQRIHEQDDYEIYFPVPASSV